MNKENPDILSFGELLADLSLRPGGAAMDVAPGGAPANLAVAACKLGARTAFAGKVGEDPIGSLLEEALRSYGVDTRGLLRTREAYTTMALATYDANGDASYSFVRKPGADQLFCIQDIPRGLVAEARFVHVGSLALSHDPCRSAAFELARVARGEGARVSFDVNWRPLAWDNEAEGLEVTRRMLRAANLVKLNQQEGWLLYREAAAADIARRVLEDGAGFVAVTLGPEGAFLASSTSSVLVAAPKPTFVADTIGAGDTFWGAALAWLVQQGVEPAGLSEETLAACGRFACAAATLGVQRSGGMASSPNREELLRAL